MEYLKDMLRINRNIVECKLHEKWQRLFIRGGINRNIVECKFGSNKVKIKPFHELIETLWNVNSSIHSCNFSQPRINRNIVECKLLIKSGLETNKCELIETLWNVNPFCLSRC